MALQDEDLDGTMMAGVRAALAGVATANSRWRALDDMARVVTRLLQTRIDIGDSFSALERRVGGLERRGAGQQKERFTIEARGAMGYLIFDSEKPGEPAEAAFPLLETAKAWINGRLCGESAAPHGRSRETLAKTIRDIIREFDVFKDSDVASAARFTFLKIADELEGK